MVLIRAVNFAHVQRLDSDVVSAKRLSEFRHAEMTLNCALSSLVAPCLGLADPPEFRPWLRLASVRSFVHLRPASDPGTST